MRLNELQRALERTYDVNAPHRVEDFLLQDARVMAQLTGTPQGPDAPPERLLVAQGEDTLDVSLFLDPEVLARVRSDSPARSLHHGNLQDFLFVLEGVSHFLFLAWSAHHDRETSLFELELQAEVDKFVTTASLLRRQLGRVATGAVRRALFRGMHLRAGLDAAERRRYREANRLADRYAGRLAPHFDGPDWQQGLARELRRFYRLPRHDKVRHIEQAQPAGP
jgi:hypothetical protein